MSIDLEKLNPSELDALINAAVEQKKRLQRNRINEVRKRLTTLAREEGYSIEELFGDGRVKPASANAGKSVAIKYRNPADTAQTWTGRGKQPRWMRALIANGKKAEDFLV